MPPPSIKRLRGVTSANKAGKDLGIKVWPVRLTWKNSQGYFRYLFRFPRYRRDDKQAIRIAESVLYAMSLVSGPIFNMFMGTRETASVVFRIPAGLARDTDSIPIDKLVQVEEARAFGDRSLDFPAGTLSTVTSTHHSDIDAAWKIAPIIFQDEALYRAVRFLKTSQDDFYVWPGQTAGVIDNPDLSAETGFEQSLLENALQNAFKAVEAVLGDPPKDDRKFFSKISSIGLDPNDEVSYTSKLPLHKVIRDMNDARDRKAAHGSTTNRTITVGEMMEYQACARLIVWAAIESKLGQSIF